MSYEVKFIEITFSNTEQIKIPIELIGDLMFSDLENMFSRVAINSFRESDIYNFVYFNINRKFAEETKLTSLFGEAINDDMTTLERINNYRDITHIKVLYSDDLSKDPKEITTVWPSDIDATFYENPLQSVRVNDAGDIEVLIATNRSKNKHLDFLEIWQRDFVDVEKMDYKWKMFS